MLQYRSLNARGGGVPRQAGVALLLPVAQQLRHAASSRPAHGSETGVVAGGVGATAGVVVTGVVAVVFVLPVFFFFFGSGLGCVVVTDGIVAVVSVIVVSVVVAGSAVLVAPLPYGSGVVIAATTGAGGFVEGGSPDPLTRATTRSVMSTAPTPASAPMRTRLPGT